jgi:hypothetical protein
MKYTYTPINEDSPQIDDIISSSWYASDYYFKGKYKWDFAIRTGINGGIPLNQYDDLYLNIGVGYVIVPNDKSCNSLDFKLGLGWYF